MTSLEIRMDETELRRVMVGLVRDLRGPGLVEWYYEQEAEPFIQVALEYAESLKPMAELDWPRVREWLNGELS